MGEEVPGIFTLEHDPPEHCQTRRVGFVILVFWHQVGGSCWLQLHHLLSLALGIERTVHDLLLNPLKAKPVIFFLRLPKQLERLHFFNSSLTDFPHILYFMPQLGIYTSKTLNIHVQCAREIAKKHCWPPLTPIPLNLNPMLAQKDETPNTTYSTDTPDTVLYAH